MPLALKAAPVTETPERTALGAEEEEVSTETRMPLADLTALSREAKEEAALSLVMRRC